MVKLRIGEILAQKEMSIKDLAEKTGLNYRTALDLSKNRYDRIGLTVIDNLCKALNITPADLFDYDPTR